MWSINEENKQLVERWVNFISKKHGRKRNEHWYFYLQSLSNQCFESNNTKGNNSPTRKFHNQLGLRANDRKLELSRCPGAMYRTSNFMAIPLCKRIGAQQGKNVHIEHTVQAVILERAAPRLFFTSEDINAARLAWLMKHSVATATRSDEQTSDEEENPPHLGKMSAEKAIEFIKENRPFSRYGNQLSKAVAIWDVVRGERVDVEKFTFDNNMDNALFLLRKAGAEAILVKKLEKARDDGSFLAEETLS